MASDQNEIVTEYQNKRALFIAFTEKLKILIKDLLEEAGIEYHMIEARAKSIESFEEKVVRSGKHYDNPIKEITDLSGVRIIVYYLDDVERVATLIKNEFTVDRANSVDKGVLLKPNEFGYRSIHYVVSLSEARQRLSEWREFKDLKGEIQIRTALQHAWAAIDQILRYKKEADVPSELRRRLFRLSGLLELADEEFSSLRDSQRRLKQEFHHRLENEDTELEINVIALWEYILMSRKVVRLVDIAEKNDARIRPIKEYDLSELVTYCTAAGFSKISDLDSFLEAKFSRVPGYFKQLMLLHPVSTNAPYLIIYVLIPSFPNVFQDVYLKGKKWSMEFVRDIFLCGKDIVNERKPET